MWMEVAVGEMEPIEVVGIVWMRGWESESPIAVDIDDVFGTSAGFSESHCSVLNDGGLGEWIQVFDGLRGVDWGALVQDQGIRDF